MADSESTCDISADGHDRVVAAVFVADRPENFTGTVRHLSEQCGLPVVVGSPPGTALGELGALAAEQLSCCSAGELISRVWGATGRHVLSVTDAVVPPPAFLDPALELLSDDMRVATVSFLSNDAAFVSFPVRNHPVERPPQGHDEVTITRSLRSRPPFLLAAPLPMATGAVVLLSSVALSVIPLEESPSADFSATLADFCFRGRQRGFIDLLDPTTYCLRPADLSVAQPKLRPVPGLSPADWEWLERRHPEASPVLEEESTASDSPLGLALTSARAKASGLRILIDGGCLGPHEMGTQVTTVAMIEALACRADVHEVCVTLPGPVPPYARALLARDKVRIGPIETLGTADIAHRPYQPNEDFVPGFFRQYAQRVVVTVHDLISFHIGGYSGDPAAWRRYRAGMRTALRQVDGVVVVSEDVHRQLALHRAPIPEESVFVVPNGTEHLTGEEKARPPEELFARGFTAGEFILCLGTNYAHKNRDLAILSLKELRRRGHDLSLVLAGPEVPWGSSRAAEAAALPSDDVYKLPEVSSEERNWLLRHASVVLYVTSAEGFGLVPYEAARFGTPTVYVPFGPLGEIGGEPPVLAADWHPSSLADATEALLSDPALARQQVASCLKAGAPYTWADAAERLTSAYRTVLARSPLGEMREPLGTLS